MSSRKRRTSDFSGQLASKSARAETGDSQLDQVMVPSTDRHQPQELGSFSNLQETVGNSQVQIQLVYGPKIARNDPSPSMRGDDGSESDQDISDSDHYEDEDEDDDKGDDGSRVDLEFSWLEHMDVKGTSMTRLGESGKPNTVAYCKAYMIRRNQIRHDFYEEIEQPSRESSMLGFDLFDRYGRLRTEFKTHPVMKGTGIWNEELDHGDMLLIEEVFVNKDFRRQGVGRRMLETLLKLAQNKTRSFVAFVYPTMLKLDDVGQEWNSLKDDVARDEIERREHNRAVMFHRSLGFRRVGSSIWFALASNTEHPSRQLAATEDFDPPEAPTTSLHPLLTIFQQIGHRHSDPRGLIREPPPRDNPDYLEALREYMREKRSTDACWTSKDNAGNTVLHLAASIFDAACVKLILEQDFGTQLLQSRNNKGETPLDLLQFKLEKLRTLKVVGMLTLSVSDRFQGHGEDVVRCLTLLKGLNSAAELQGGEASLRIKMGCTCGQCLKGFLSPRMLKALQTQAEIGYDMLNNGIDLNSGPDWVESEEYSLGYLPTSVRENLKTNKSMRHGFTNLWAHVATCLTEGWVPTEPNVIHVAQSASEWPPATANFLQRGGTVESVFLAICKTAMEQDEWVGDGMYQEIFGADIASLPECRNDLEFGFVSGMCGFRRISLTEHVDMWGNVVDE